MGKTLIERLKDEEMYVDAIDEAIEHILFLEGRVKELEEITLQKNIVLQ